MASYLRDVCTWLNPPGWMQRYATTSGAAPSKKKYSNFDCSGTYDSGCYDYSASALKMSSTVPILGGKIWFKGSQNQKFRDCVPHSVNYALMGPMYTKREQVMKLMVKNASMDYKKAKMQKEKSGVPMRAFVDFTVHDG